MTDRPMTEEELLEGITDALTLAGWWWMHIRRSDQALVMGMQGFPDVFAVHADRGMMLAWELKSETGRPTYEQVAWLNMLRRFADGFVGWGHSTLDVRIVTPRDYDKALSLIIHGGGWL